MVKLNKGVINMLASIGTKVSRPLINQVTKQVTNQIRKQTNSLPSTVLGDKFTWLEKLGFGASFGVIGTGFGINYRGMVAVQKRLTTLSDRQSDTSVKIESLHGDVKLLGQKMDSYFNPHNPTT